MKKFRRKAKKQEITTTANVPVYFPGRRKDRWKQTWDSKEEDTMNSARFALRLVEKFGLSAQAALKVVVEEDVKGAAKKLSESIKDPAKREKAAKKYESQLVAALRALSLREEDEPKKPEDEDDEDPDKKKEEEGDDEDPEKKDKDKEEEEDDENPFMKDKEKKKDGEED